MRSLRDVWRTDWPRRGPAGAARRWSARCATSARWSGSSTRRGPTSWSPRSARETFRTAAHLIGLERGIDVLFLFYTIFPNPLRLYRNTMHAPIVAPGRAAAR